MNRAQDLDVHMDAEHVDQRSRSSSRSRSRSFICPDCGLGMESIAALTVHLLTHAAMNSDNEAVSSLDGHRSSSTSGHRSGTNASTTVDGKDKIRGPTSARHDDDDDDNVLDVGDYRVPLNRDQSEQRLTAREPASGDLGQAVQGHHEGESDDEPQCLKVERRQCSSVDDTLEDVVRLECPYCQRKDFDSVAPLTSHIRTAHARPSDNLFTCSSCGLAFATVGKLDHHRQTQHGTPPSTAAVSTRSSASGDGSPPSAVDGLTEARWLCRLVAARHRSVITLACLVIIRYHFHTYAAQASFLCISTNIFFGGRLRLSWGRSRKVYVLIAVSTVPSWSSAVYLRFSELRMWGSDFNYECVNNGN